MIAVAVTFQRGHTFTKGCVLVHYSYIIVSKVSIFTKWYILVYFERVLKQRQLLVAFSLGVCELEERNGS